MTLRIKHKVWLNIARDTDMNDLVHGPSETSRSVITDIFDQWDAGSFDVADSANEDLPLGDITNIKGLYVEANQEVKVKLNGSTTELQLRKPNTAATAVAKLFIEADINQVNIVNDSGEVAKGIYVIWGSSV